MSFAMEKNKISPISSILENVVDPDLFEKYRSKLSLSVNADYLYQWALISLNESNSDKAISFLIAALDLDRKHNPSLHLLKSMVVGLSKEFYENGGSTYKQKFNTFEEAAQNIKKKAIALKKKNEKIKLEVQLLERNMKEGFFVTRFFKKMTMEKQLLSLKTKLVENLDKIDTLKKELKKVRKFQKNEEYSKLLGTILEICIMPKKYSKND